MTGRWSRRRRSIDVPPSWSAFVVLAVCLAAVVGAAVFVVVRQPDTPDSLTGGGARSEVLSTPTKVDDQRQVELVPEMRDGAAARVLRSGTLTSLDCKPGDTVRNGSFPVAVDGVRLLALSTDVPLWRDLDTGTTGADVTAVQQTLKSLGTNVKVTGRFDEQTRRGLRTLYGKAGRTWEGSTLRRDAVVWLPPNPAAVASCEAELGQQLSAGDPILKLRSTVLAFAFKAVPKDLVAGPRILAIGDVRVPIIGYQPISGPREVAALGATEAFRAWLDAEGKIPLPASLVLAEPILALPVPAAAVAVSATGAACLQRTQGGPLAITVVGSSMGRSLVTWDGISAEPVTVLIPEADFICG
ncbi:peptidoglycan-binding domain-containing protein [Dactylosporangium sucinum]|uniref:Peptidoglycan binding-like domain-containing protein n=1 Tax=Dactylosporangium sucinum TaxID=1424081 RepID=A0A917WZT5_9ACTN|nr:peptidoglycan-binding protein [Dactylosporangium sucinum]GGM51103.1 hypothetical protein GCM10007977_061140 [Dactylosporangium sucinum]